VGRLVAQQLVAAGERVPGVQPEVAARVRQPGAGNTNKNDPDDARSVAIAALRSATGREVAAEDHTAVLKVWSRRYRDLDRARTPVEASSGSRTIHRLTLRGSRRPSHAIHMAAVTQIRHPHSDGRACFDRKLA
jgi:hypothetical protein